MTGCSAFGCSNRDSKGYKLITFPKDPKRRAQWVAAVNRPELLSKNAWLCEVIINLNNTCAICI